MSLPASMVLLRSPSLNTPIIPPDLPITVVKPKPFSLISSSAFVSVVSADTLGISSPECMTSFTFTNKRRPSFPPGWDNAKSLWVKPRASSNAIAMASPITRVAVVLDVGASPNGQASSST